MDDKKIFNLTKDDTIIYGIEGGNEFLGGETIEDNDDIRMAIGSKPVLLNLRDFIKLSGKKIPDDLEIFNKYDAYILPHTVSVLKESGFKKVKEIGYRMEFTEDNQWVFDILPQTKFITRFKGEFKTEASLNINGTLGIPEDFSKMLDKVDYLGAGGKIQASSDNSVIGNLSFSTYTNEIQAIGKNSDYSEWVFSKADLPLFGNDIIMNQILLVKKNSETINFRCKAYVNISSFLGINSVRRETDWLDIEVKVINN